MNYKKFFVGVLLTVVMSFGITAYAEVTKISPDKNIGVYTSEQSVSFIITRDDSSFDEALTYTVENIDGTVVTNGNATILNGNTECTIKPGNFLPGWYRLRMYDNASNEIDIFASFTVVDKRTVDVKNTPFSAVLWGYSGLDASVIPDYAEAFGILGFDKVRDGAGWYWGSGASASMDKVVDPLCENKITPLLTYSVHNDHMGTEKDYSGNLYTIHNMLNDLSSAYDGRVGRWEITNEPDLKSEQLGFSADMYSAYYKAAALAVEEGSPDAQKSFGGLCQKYPDFFELMMLNGVADYTDSFNIHRHATSNLLKNNIDFPNSLLKRAKVYSAIYGENQPLCVSEAGISASVDGNGVQETEHLKVQAKYAITSFVESIGMYGTTEHYWFSGKHYLENGQNWGSTSPEHCTYPVFYSLSLLTKYLGEAKPIGTIATSDTDISGYFFDAGEYDAAVLWNSGDDIKYQQLKTKDSVIVNSLIGGSKYVYPTSANGYVNIPLTSEPVVVRFSGESNKSNYRSKTFESDFVRDITRTTGDKIVIQAVWDDEPAVENGRYVLAPGETYNITLKIYNFSDETFSDEIFINVDDSLEVEGNSSQSFTVASEDNAEIATVSFAVRVSENAENAQKGYLSFSGNDINDVVCGYIVNIDLTRENAGEITELLSGMDAIVNPWTNGNATLGISREMSKNLFDTACTFKASFSGGNRFWYPSLPKTVPATSDGLVFDVKGISTGANTYMGVYAYVSGGSYWLKLDTLEIGNKTYVLPWDKFTTYSGEIPDELNPADITRISIGFNTSSDDEVKYTLSNIGTYDSPDDGEEPEDENLIKLSGVVDNGIYYEGTNAKLCITGNFDDVYLNYEEFYDYSETETGAVIELGDFEESAYSIIVTQNTEFGKKEYKEICFYIKDRQEHVQGGTFY